MSQSVTHLWGQHIKPRADQRYPHAIVVVDSGVVPIAAGDTGEAIAGCPAGKIALGGGYGSAGFDETMLVARSAPLPDDTGWRMVASNPGTGAGSVIAYAVCAAVG